MNPFTLQAASIVLHNAPEDGSQWNTWATKVSCAVCIIKAHCFTFFPIPKNDKYLTRHSVINLSS